MKIKESCLWTFPDSAGVVEALCLVFVDDFMLSVHSSLGGRGVSEFVNNLYDWGVWESRVFTQCGARITQAYDKHTQTWSGFQVNFDEYVKKISVISLCGHRRRQRMTKLTLFQLSQLRVLNGQLLRLAMQCCWHPCHC